LPHGPRRFLQGSQGIFVAFTTDFLAQLAVWFFSQVIFFTARSAKVFAGFARFFSLRSPRDSWRTLRLSILLRQGFRITARSTKICTWLLDIYSFLILIFLKYTLSPWSVSRICPCLACP